jgi:hypothetical protein
MRLDRAAFLMVTAFFRAHPDVYAQEAAEHGCWPLHNVDLYFARELQEPVHAQLLWRALFNRGVITADLVAAWIDQELYCERRHHSLFARL